MSIPTPTYTRLSDRGVSFAVLRTNPKLTSNVKLTVDSAGKLWLNSIDAAPDLAQNKYKNFPISASSNHEVNIFKFYDNGNTQSQISFALGTSITTDTVAKDLKDQFDFDLYTSGAKYLTSNNYKEKFAYFAPIYIDEVLPECFVIFKVPGASNYTVGEWKEKLADPTFDRKKFAFDLFKNAVSVKTILMTDDTEIGQYIRNIQRNEMYPRNPLYVNFKEDRFSVYRGISINAGTYVEIPEFLGPTLKRSIPQLKLEQYITEGFERNNIIYPRILNLEFLFDDDTSEQFTFNRYFGFYCNLVDLTQFDLDAEAMYANMDDNDNPLPFVFGRDSDLILTASNENGVVLRGIGVEYDVTDLGSAMSDETKMFFPYLKSKDGSVQFVKTGSMEQMGSRIKFAVDDAHLDLGQLFGPGSLFSQETATQGTEDTRSTVAVTFDAAPTHLETLRVYHRNGTKYDSTDPYGRYDDIVMVSSYFSNGEEYVLDYTFETGESVIYVNLDNATVNAVPYTDPAKLAATVCKVVGELKNSRLTGRAFGSTAFLQVKQVGNSYGALAVKAVGTLSSKVRMNGSSTTDTVYADGGFFGRKQAILPIGNVPRISQDINDIIVKTDVNWSFIQRICNSTDGLVGDDPITLDQYNSYFNNAVLMLKDDEEIVVSYNKIEIRNVYRPTMGVLSIFDFKDLDFYTYSTQYSRIPEIDFFKTYYVPKDTPILNFMSYVYTMVGKGKISVNGTVYSTEDPSLEVWQNVDALCQYSVIAGDVILVQTSKVPSNQLINRYDIPILDENENLQNFTGFFALGADHSVPDPNLPTYSYREKFRTSNLASEYHVYLENFSKDFSVEGRVVPYIAKWGIIDSTDARGNPYRLDSDIMFGKDNFGPSHREVAPTAEKLTHEWFYIESAFNYTDAENLVKKNEFYFDYPFSVSEFVSDPTYFDRYFTYIPTFGGKEVAKPQFRFSKLERDQFSKQYYTVFNGAKFVFSELSTDGKVLPETSRFDGYSFSILLKPIKEDLQNPQLPIRYRVLENTNAKAIVILIELAVSDITEVEPSLLVDTYLSPGNLKFPDKRMDQTTSFLDAYIITDTRPSIFDIEAIYTTSNDVQGDSVFTSILNGSYPSFSSTAFLNGTAIDPHTGLTFWNWYPTPTTAFLVKKGSDPTLGYVISFADSPLFKMVATGKLQSGSINQYSNVTMQYLKISNTKLGYLRNMSSQFRVIEDASGSLLAISLSPDFNLVVSRSVPGMISMFGDYRFSFNEDGVSNLTYNMLYSIKDKKYNSTRGSYSTVKLAKGIDISPNGVSEKNDTWFIPAKSLVGLQTMTLRLENFVNPKSGSHDTRVNTNPPTTVLPMPPFAPIMFISNTGTISMLVNTSADFTDPQFNIGLALSDPAITDHAIINVSDNLLTANKPSGPKVTSVVDITLQANAYSGVNFNFTQRAFPTGVTANWLANDQQFQLFGGAGYFAGLFENLSFAKFVDLMDARSDLITWELYTDGSVNSGIISISVEDSDTITKNTIVTMIPETVNTATKAEVGGITHDESQSTEYDVSRYSGEYDVMYKQVSAFEQKSIIDGVEINGANVLINPGIDDFFLIPEFSFVKFSNFNILDFENSDKYEPVYPMIYESPIDFDKYDVLSSSWDFNYHYEYSTKKDRTKIPGSRRVTEDYSFVSKLLNVPLTAVAESFLYVQLSNQEFDITNDAFLALTQNGSIVDLAYSVYGDEIRFKINFPQIVAKTLSENGYDGVNRLRVEFEKFFKDSLGNPITKDPDSLGDLTFDQFLYQYCKTNLVKLYSLDTIDFYQKDNRDIPENSILIVEVPYDQLDEAGYEPVKTVKINNSGSDVITGSIFKKTNSGVNLVPKLKIKYI